MLSVRAAGGSREVTRLLDFEIAGVRRKLEALKSQSPLIDHDRLQKKKIQKFKIQNSKLIIS
jgi:hypothetical protein